MRIMIIPIFFGQEQGSVIRIEQKLKINHNSRFSFRLELQLFNVMSNGRRRALIKHAVASSRHLFVTFWQYVQFTTAVYIHPPTVPNTISKPNRKRSNLKWFGIRSNFRNVLFGNISHAESEQRMPPKCKRHTDYRKILEQLYLE